MPGGSRTMERKKATKKLGRVSREEADGGGID